MFWKSKQAQGCNDKLLTVNDVHKSTVLNFFEGLRGLCLPIAVAVSIANTISSSAFTWLLVFGGETVERSDCFALPVSLADFFVSIFITMPIVSFKICLDFPFKLDRLLTSSLSKSMSLLEYSYIRKFFIAPDWRRGILALRGVVFFVQYTFTTVIITWWFRGAKKVLLLSH